VTEFTLGLVSGFSHGRAFSEALSPASPAAGAGFTINISSRYWERFGSLAFRLVSNGNAANRQVVLTVADNDGISLAAFPAASVQVASKTYDYFFMPNLNSFNTLVGTVITSPAPSFFLQPGWSLVVAVGAMDAADQISNIRWYPERFVTGPQGYRQGAVDEDEYRRLALIRLSELLS
jgi:hypothetical protein